MTQVKLPPRTKLELARNYWDEMGRGAAAGMHGPMLDRLVATLKVDPRIETTVWESLALANARVALKRLLPGVCRQLAPHLTGELEQLLGSLDRSERRHALRPRL